MKMKRWEKRESSNIICEGLFGTSNLFDIEYTQFPFKMEFQASILDLDYHVESALLLRSSCDPMVIDNTNSLQIFRSTKGPTNGCLL